MHRMFGIAEAPWHSLDRSTGAWNLILRSGPHFPRIWYSVASYALNLQCSYKTKKGRNRRRGEQEKERKRGQGLGSRVTFLRTAYLYPSCVFSDRQTQHYSNIIQYYGIVHSIHSILYAVYWHSLSTLICLRSRNKVDNSIAPIYCIPPRL